MVDQLAPAALHKTTSHPTAKLYTAVSELTNYASYCDDPPVTSKLTSTLHRLLEVNISTYVISISLEYVRHSTYVKASFK